VVDDRRMDDDPTRCPGTARRPGLPTSSSKVALRAVLIHMVEGYARHNGHADLLRERIDGRVGQ